MNVFQLSSSIDYIILITGTVCAAATGVAIPYMNILFGEILDQLNEDSTKNDFQNGVNKVAILFGYVSLVIFVSGTMKVHTYIYIVMYLRDMYDIYIYRCIVGLLLVNVNLKEYVRCMLLVSYDRKLDGLMQEAPPHCQLKCRIYVEK